MPNAEVDEAEIAKLVSDGGLKPETQKRGVLLENFTKTIEMCQRS